MKKLTLSSIISLVCLFGFSQNVEITLYQNSIKLCNDTLYFKYQIENKSDSILVLYNLESVSVKLKAEYTDSQDFYEGAWPGFKVIITDSNDEYPTTVMSIDGFRPPETSIPPSPPSPPIKYTVLQPHQNTIYDNILIIRNEELLNDSLFEVEKGIHSFLQKGIHKFQLEYFSGPAFRKRFNKDKQRDNSLKNSVMFEGIIKSNVCTFTYPADYVQPESDQTDEAALKEADNDKSTVEFPYFEWVKKMCYVVVIVVFVILLCELLKRRL